MSSSLPSIAVLDYGMGNLRSVTKALEHAGARPEIVSDPNRLAEMDAVVFPGQGALGDCVAALRSTGMDTAILDWIRADKPYLGICLGLQALFGTSEEAEEPALGVFPGRTVRFRLPPDYKIPHMGWNAVEFRQADCPLRAGLPSSGEPFYFVHSYYVEPADSDVILGVTDYGGEFVSAVARGRCIATQFHPEKSQQAGLRVYSNFVRMAAIN